MTTSIPTSTVDLGASGGAIYSTTIEGQSTLKIVDSVFKKNKAAQVSTTASGGGGAVSVDIIFGGTVDVLVLSSVFELNEANRGGGAAQFFAFGFLNVDWINNKELLFGNDAGTCDGVNTFEPISNAPFIKEGCFNVGDNEKFLLGP